MLKTSLISFRNQPNRFINKIKRKITSETGTNSGGESIKNFHSPKTIKCIEKLSFSDLGQSISDLYFKFRVYSSIQKNESD